MLVLNFAILNMAVFEQCTVLVGEAREELLEYAVAMLLDVACYLTFFLLNTSRVFIHAKITYCRY